MLFTAGYTGGDGIVFVPLDTLMWLVVRTATRLLPMLTLSEAALEQAVIDIAGYRDDRGLLDCGIKPEKLVIPHQLQF